MPPREAVPSLLVQPIGVVHSPWEDKRSAPRQPALARGTVGTIELYDHAQYEDALCDLEGWSHIWVMFWFHLSEGFRSKVQPPRSEKKRGVFSTRAPYRPNPLGLSLLRLDRIEGRTLHVVDLDMIDGTPVLDVKPYVAYTDTAVDARSGWLEGDADPGPQYTVAWSERAQAQLAWLRERTALDLRQLAETVLAAGPAPHAYRRIKALDDHLRLSVKDFRLRFVVRGTEILIQEIASGYRRRVLDDPRALASEETPLDVHRAFVAHFEAPSTH